MEKVMGWNKELRHLVRHIENHRLETEIFHNNSCQTKTNSNQEMVLMIKLQVIKWVLLSRYLDNLSIIQP